MIEGGMHAGGKIDFQEYIVIPSGNDYRGSLENGVAVYRALQKNIKKQFGEACLNVGYEGALTPTLDKNEDPLKLIAEAVKEVGSSGDELFIDAAATSFYRDGKYHFEGKNIEKQDLIDYYRRLVSKYPIIGLEDGLQENDFDGFSDLVKEFGQKIKIVGDDLLTTNIQRIKTAINAKACNGLILKPNQAGTVTETIDAAKTALSANWKVFVKHRGGESNDDFIADLAVGLGTGYLLSGAPARGERVAKYNQLIRIEEDLNG
jgi:enolase